MRTCSTCRWYEPPVLAEEGFERIASHCTNPEANTIWQTDPTGENRVAAPCMSARDMRHYGPCGWHAHYWEKQIR